MELNNVEILLVDDEAIHTEILKKKLQNLGYINVSVVNSFLKAVDYLNEVNPDLIILDYYLDKNHTGVDLVKESLLNKEIPIIFISSFYGNDLFKEVIGCAPIDFVPKNVSEFDLDKTIRLSLIKRKEANINKKLKDFIFVKYKREIRKLAVIDIEYMVVDGKYLVLHADQKKYLIRSTLNDFLKKLPENFIKVHQAYIINLRFLESIQLDEGILKIGTVDIPFSRNYKKDLLNAYYMP
ncbi:MAG: response regulator transcription factor [Saprospiraceae bacterium]